MNYSGEAGPADVAAPVRPSAMPGRRQVHRPRENRVLVGCSSSLTGRRPGRAVGSVAPSPQLGGLGWPSHAALLRQARDVRPSDQRGNECGCRATSPRTGASRRDPRRGVRRCVRKTPATPPGRVHNGSGGNSFKLRVRRDDPSQERAAVFGRGVLGYSTKRMMTTTTAITSAAIAMLRVLMATSVYLVAPAPARIWRLGDLERADRSEPPGGAFDGRSRGACLRSTSPPAESRQVRAVPGTDTRSEPSAPARRH